MITVPEEKCPSFNFIPQVLKKSIFTKRFYFYFQQKSHILCYLSFILNNNSVEKINMQQAYFFSFLIS